MTARDEAEAVGRELADLGADLRLLADGVVTEAEAALDGLGERPDLLRVAKTVAEVSLLLEQIDGNRRATREAVGRLAVAMAKLGAEVEED